MVTNTACYEVGTNVVLFKTVIGGFYALHDALDGEAPFQLGKQMLKAREKVDLSSPLNFVTTHDITGGDSGSPAINQDLEIVGRIIDVKFLVIQTPTFTPTFWKRFLRFLKWMSWSRSSRGEKVGTVLMRRIQIVSSQPEVFSTDSFSELNRAR